MPGSTATATMLQHASQHPKQQQQPAVRWTLDDLLQELIAALLGYTGDVFVDSAAAADAADPSSREIAHPERCTVSLAPDIALAEDVSREELNRLVQVCFHVQQIKAFMQQEQHPAAGGKKSLYRCALCCGLDELLCLHEDEVVMLQDQLLTQQQQGGAGAAGGAFSLPGITYRLADLQRLLLHVHHMVYELRRRPADYATGSSSSDSAVSGGLVLLPQTCGARLLHWLAERRGHGEPVLRVCTQRLMWHVHQVMFNQLTLWMVHGQLINGDEEFMIQLNADSAAVGAAAADGSKGAAGEPAAAAADTDAVRDGGGSSRTGGVAETTANHQGKDTALMSEEDTYRDFHSAFVANHLQLPPGMSTHTADSVEFVGRAVRLLKSAPAAAKLRAMQDSCGSSSYLNTLQQQQQGGAGAPGGSSSSSSNVPQQLLPYGDSMAYAAALCVLSQQAEYNPAALARTVEAIRADVAARVWQLVVVDSRLMCHLSALKDYMLLARGDFYQCFLADAAGLLTLPADRLASKDLAVPWQSAASKSSAADDPLQSHFRLVVDRKLGKKRQQELQAHAVQAVANASNTGSSASLAAAKAAAPLLGDLLGVAGEPCVADCLKLEAQLPWPLGVLITCAHVAEYNSLFALLLKMKRAQLDLEAAWQELGRLCGRKGGSQTPRDLGALLQLRQHMGHLVSNLQVYLQLDVIEANFDALHQRVAAAQDYAGVAKAHADFMRDVKDHALLALPRVIVNIHRVFGLAGRLRRVIEKARGGSVDWEKVAAIRSVFNPVVNELCLTMRSKFLLSKGKAPHLTKLYDRLDYNGYIHRLITPGQAQPRAGVALATGSSSQQQQQQQRPAVVRSSAH